MGVDVHMFMRESFCARAHILNGFRTPRRWSKYTGTANWPLVSWGGRSGKNMETGIMDYRD